jgi:thiamine-phosphate pyrophosphorylase
MADDTAPQIYLVSPPAPDLASFPSMLARVLDAVPVACLRLDLATRDADTLIRAADACREVATARDVALVIAGHVQLAERLGLDGVHLDGPRGVRAARSALGPDAIVGAACGASRHDGIVAGEAGADYVAFGPVGGAALGDGHLAERELFAWWSEMIELPVVAEGGLSQDLVANLWDVTDFFAFGEEVWRAEDPAARLAALAAGPR